MKHGFAKEESTTEEGRSLSLWQLNYLYKRSGGKMGIAPRGHDSALGGATYTRKIFTKPKFLREIILGLAETKKEAEERVLMMTYPEANNGRSARDDEGADCRYKI